MKLGENIYRLRTGKKLSQGDLADQLEVSRQSVSKWENGVSVPDLDKLIRMSELFAVTLDTLVNGPVPETAEETEKPAEESADPAEEAPAEAETPNSAETEAPKGTITETSGVNEPVLSGEPEENTEKVYPPTWPALPAYKPGPTAEGSGRTAVRHMPWKRIFAATAAVVVLGAALALDYVRLFKGGLNGNEMTVNAASTPAPSEAVDEPLVEDYGYIPIEQYGIYSFQTPDHTEDADVVIFALRPDAGEELNPTEEESWVSLDEYTCVEQIPHAVPRE